jgi:hypothetical protein
MRIISLWLFYQLLTINYQLFFLHVHLCISVANNIFLPQDYYDSPCVVWQATTRGERIKMEVNYAKNSANCHSRLSAVPAQAGECGNPDSVSSTE